MKNGNVLRGGQAPDPSSIINSHRQKMRQKVQEKSSPMSDSDKIELRKKLAAIMNTEDKDYSGEAKQVRSLILEEMEKEFQDKLQYINFDTGNVGKSSIQNALGKFTDKIRITKNQKTIKVKTLYDRVNSIKSNIEKIKSPMNRQEINKIINNTETYLSQVLHITKEELDQAADSSYLIDLDTKKVENVIGELNRCITLMSGTPPVNLQKGELFEFMVAAAQAMGKGKGLQEIKETMESMKLGRRKRNSNFRPIIIF